VVIPPKSNVHALLRKIEFEYVPAVRSAEFFRNLRGRIFNVIAEVAEQGMRKTSGSFEKAIAGHVEGLIADISKTLGDETRISMPNDLSVVFERLDFLSSEQAISLDHRGDGIKGRYIPLILKFLADQKRTLNTQGTAPYTFIWAYEEPENNLEFRRAQQLAVEFCELADGDQTQVLLTTHSPVFFNLAQGSESRKALHISLKDPVEGTKLEEPADSASDLDERMGVMPIVAPYVRKAEQKLLMLAERNSEIQELLDRQNLPACFVEGTSDFLVYSAILTTMLPKWRERLHLVSPPSIGAGASYVADHLVSWHSTQKHRPIGERKRAIGLFDKDAAGDNAKKTVSALNDQSQLVRAFSLPKSPAVRAAARRDLIVPIALEECYPAEWWSHADQQGWLEDREPTSVLSETTKNRIILGGTTFDELVEGLEAEFMIRRRVADSSKVKWAGWVSRRPDDQLQAKLGHLVDLMTEGLTFLGIALEDV
jgi:hypothetical protein